jgi:hypothetical protein
MRSRSFWLFGLLLSLSGHGVALELSPQYLAGYWCNTHMQFGAQRQDEGRNYRFEEDGTFSQQVSLSSDRMKSGFNYEIGSGLLKMSPVFLGEMKVLSVQPEKFVVKWHGDIYFARGKCR